MGDREHLTNQRVEPLPRAGAVGRFRMGLHIGAIIRRLRCLWMGGRIGALERMKPDAYRKRQPGTGTKFGTAVWGSFGVFFSYLWVRDAIREHWGILRWIALIWFLGMTVGPLFLLA